jgi:transposase-like protein
MARMNYNGIQDQIRCPVCNAVAVYRYGKVKNHKQRYLCMMCGRQFTLDHSRMEYRGKPLCPICGKAMHVYMKENQVIRFRCSSYPDCRTYKKIAITKEGMNELLLS